MCIDHRMQMKWIGGHINQLTFVRSRILYSPNNPLSFIRFAETIFFIALVQSILGNNRNLAKYSLTTVSIWKGRNFDGISNLVHRGTFEGAYLIYEKSNILTL